MASCITWSYTLGDCDFADIQADELKTHLMSIINTSKLDLITQSNGTLLIRPENVNKGAFLAKVLQDKYRDKKFDLLFIIGCDDTDEEMFKYLKSSVKYFYNFVKKFKIISTTITKHMSCANYYFNEINDCVENLEYIIKERNKDLSEGKIHSPYFKKNSSNKIENKSNIFNFQDDDD